MKDRTIIKNIENKEWSKGIKVASYDKVVEIDTRQKKQKIYQFKDDTKKYICQFGDDTTLDLEDELFWVEIFEDEIKS